MKPRRFPSLVAAVFVILPLIVPAQPAPNPQPAAPRLHRPAGRLPEGWNAEIEQFLKQLCQTYATVDTYRDQGRVTMVQQQGKVKTTTEMPMELSFKRPNRLFLDAGQHQVACDGKSLVIAVGALRQYTSRPAPAKLERKHLEASSVMGGVEQGHPELIDLCIRPDAYDLWQKQMIATRWKPGVTVRETSCRVLEYETLDHTIVRIFADSSRMLLLKVEAESTNEMGVITVNYDLGTVALNGPINDGEFAFTPPQSFRRVGQFGGAFEQQDHLPKPNDDAAQPVAIIGRKAALISGQDLQGRPFAPEELRGKVALLFFWSLAGGQYSLISMPVVQNVADHFQSDPNVIVLGISGDADKRDLIRQMMDRKKCSFRTVLDEGQSLRHAYEIGGEPTFVIVDSEGKVAWARLGAPPTLRQDLLRELSAARNKRVSK
ncbi:MAG: TlpA family protein disulfide reductase [Verrucomicrobia subdivision 3 bacterium]|nr:TlpA family protein disulfide reductase [Limisphaerales bacterium]